MLDGRVVRPHDGRRSATRAERGLEARSEAAAEELQQRSVSQFTQSNIILAQDKPLKDAIPVHVRWSLNGVDRVDTDSIASLQLNERCTWQTALEKCSHE